MVPENPNPADLAAIPVIDPDGFARLREDGGDPAAARFLVTYQEMARYQLVGASRAAEAREWNAVGQSARDLKEGAEKLGLPRLASACFEIERACAEADLEVAARLLSELQQYVLEGLDAVRELARDQGVRE